MEGVRFAGQFSAEGLLCSPCRMAPPEFERAVAYALYQDELREMVHLLKYERMSAVARPLGRMLARAIEMIESEAASFLPGGVELVIAQRRAGGCERHLEVRPPGHCPSLPAVGHRRRE